jgi:hypothetical protein
MPTWGKININDHIDDAAAIGLNLKRSFADVEVYGRVLNWNTDEIPPAARSGRWVGLAPRFPRQQHASKHP